jgi:excisionase family DNA binding protein
MWKVSPKASAWGGMCRLWRVKLPATRGDAVDEGYRLLTVREVADVMRVSTMTVYRLIRGGELPATRVGKHFRIPTRDLEGYLESQSTRGGDAWPAA